MAIHNPPYYRYALLEPWDKEAFALIKEIGRTKSYPKLKGSREEKNTFLIALLRTQKSLHDWRNFLKDMMAQITQSGTIDTAALTAKYPPESISKNRSEWATYEGDIIVDDFIDALATRNVDFIGTDAEISLFVMRFFLGQLGHDWEQTIMMIWEMLGDKDNLRVKLLNAEMKNFDYLGFFT